MKDKGWRDEPEADRPRGQHGEGLADSSGKGTANFTFGGVPLVWSKESREAVENERLSEARERGRSWV